MQFKFLFGNNFRVDGNVLEASESLEYIEEVLGVSRILIHEQHAKYPLIWLIRLNTDRKMALKPEVIGNRKSGIYSRDDLVSELLPVWDTVASRGYHVEARMVSNPGDKNSLYLLIGPHP